MSLLLDVPTFASDSLVDRSAAAVGGREKIAAIHSIYRAVTMEVGANEGTIKVWHTAGGTAARPSSSRSRLQYSSNQIL